MSLAVLSSVALGLSPEPYSTRRQEPTSAPPPPSTQCVPPVFHPLNVHTMIMAKQCSSSFHSVKAQYYETQYWSIPPPSVSLSSFSPSLPASSMPPSSATQPLSPTSPSPTSLPNGSIQSQPLPQLAMTGLSAPYSALPQPGSLPSKCRSMAPVKTTEKKSSSLPLPSSAPTSAFTDASGNTTTRRPSKPKKRRAVTKAKLMASVLSSSSPEAVGGNAAAVSCPIVPTSKGSALSTSPPSCSPSVNSGDSKKPKVNTEKWFKCDYEFCSYQTPVMAYMRRHCSNIHGVKVKWISCPVQGCNYKAKTGGITRHLRHFHNLNPVWYPCEWEGCGYRAKQAFDLARHRKRHLRPGYKVRRISSSIDSESTSTSTESESSSTSTESMSPSSR